MTSALTWSRKWLACVFALVASAHALAAIDAFQFANTEQESRYRALVDELRCPQCLNTNLSGSDSPIAADLRLEVYRQIVAGKSDDEIRTFMLDRYGDFILYRPRLELAWMLYVVPVGLLAIGVFVIVRLARRASATPLPPLTDDQNQTLKHLLEQTETHDAK